eukprot:350797-Chlamydomonas_euryale.AAC.1
MCGFDCNLGTTFLTRTRSCGWPCGAGGVRGVACMELRAWSGEAPGSCRETMAQLACSWRVAGMQLACSRHAAALQYESAARPALQSPSTQQTLNPKP